MELNDAIQSEIETVILDAYRVSTDIGEQVDTVLREGRENLLTAEEAIALLDTAVTTLKTNAAHRGDTETAKALKSGVQTLLERVASTRTRVVEAACSADGARPVELVSQNGIDPRPVSPRPVFHGMEVSMNGGFFKTSDIALWDKNLRLDIHLSQFQQKTGRRPTPTEVLDIMLGRTDMPGLPAKDQFEIEQLARSIAINGVRKPPIIDVDGTLLDGNRRVAACHFILNSDAFDSDQKKRAEYIFVWQLTKHATQTERHAVVVSLNFESDHKQDWPEYIKAKEIYKEWHAMLALEPRAPSAQQQKRMKSRLSTKFALGPDTMTVTRYLKMVDWAQEFEDYHINERERDQFEVKHRANRYFQYFDELGKGAKPGGVAHALNQDESLKHLVFDLLFDGKFRNWSQIRQLRYVPDKEEARDALKKARDESDLEEAQEHVENAMTIARHARAEQREVGANARIETFVKWLESLPVRAFRDTIKHENLGRLQEALHLVEKHLDDAPGKGAE